MAITHKILWNMFLRGEGVIEVANRYALPLTTVEDAIRRSLRDKTYEAPVQMVIEAPVQMTIAERYGEITV